MTSAPPLFYLKEQDEYVRFVKQEGKMQKTGTDVDRKRRPMVVLAGFWC